MVRADTGSSEAPCKMVPSLTSIRINTRVGASFAFLILISSRSNLKGFIERVKKKSPFLNLRAKTCFTFVQ